MYIICIYMIQILAKLTNIYSLEVFSEHFSDDANELLN